MVVPKPNHREAVLELMKKKEDLEEQINVHGQTLRRVSVVICLPLLFIIIIANCIAHLLNGDCLGDPLNKWAL